MMLARFLVPWGILFKWNMYLHLIPGTTKRKHKTSLEDTDIGKDFLKRSPTALEIIN